MVRWIYGIFLMCTAFLVDAHTMTSQQVIANIQDAHVKKTFEKMVLSLPNFNYKNLEAFQLDNGQVVTLEGLEQFTSIKTLSLKNNFIEKISPLCRLSELESLNLEGNIIKLATCLSSLKQLKFLNLSNNQIKYAYCCSYNSIQQLNLSGNQIQQLIFSEGSNHFLNFVDVSNNPLTEIKVLSILNSLKVFKCNTTLINHLKCFIDIKNLEVLEIGYCRNLTSIADLFSKYSIGLTCKLPKLKELVVSEEYLDDNSKHLLELVRSGALNRTFILNKKVINSKPQK